jgi:transcription termination factor Rho
MTAIMQESAAPPGAPEKSAKSTERSAGIPVSGIVDTGDGHAFVRTSGYRRGPADVSVSAAQIRQYGLRKGDLIEGAARLSQRGGPASALARVDSVNGMTPELARLRPHFDDLTPLYPQQRQRDDPRARAAPSALR